MCLTRRSVLEELASATDAKQAETTSVEAIAATLEADTATIRTHLEHLENCALVRTEGNGRARVTVTGEHLLELDIDDVVVVDPDTASEK